MEWLISIGTGVAAWFVGLIPASAAPVPADIAGLDGTVNAFLGGLSGMGGWVPWAFMIFCAGVSVAVWSVTTGTKFIAWIWGQIPVIGGAG